MGMLGMQQAATTTCFRASRRMDCQTTVQTDSVRGRSDYWREGQKSNRRRQDSVDVGQVEVEVRAVGRCPHRRR